MNTKNPISTVSYNSIGYLTRKLDELIKCKKIEYYVFIHHKGEVNDLGIVEKDHTHLYVVPNGRINTVELGQEFYEYVDNNPKPLKCILWVPSKKDEWILYTSHNEQYLMTKFETRQYQYSFEEFVTSDEEQFKRDFVSSFQSSGYAKNKNFYNYIKNGGTLGELMQVGAVSPNQVAFYNDFIEAVKKSTNVVERGKFIKEKVMEEIKRDNKK